MMKLENLGVKVRVIPGEKERIDKWADCCNGKKLSERLNLHTNKTEKVYHFRSVESKEEFLAGLNVNFGSAVEIL